MIGRNFTVKGAENFFEHNAKTPFKNSFRYREIIKKRKYFTRLCRQ